MGNKYYYYYEIRDRIVEYHVNPCSCHPYDVIKTWGKKWGESVSLSFKNEDELKLYMVNQVDKCLKLDFWGE